MELVEHRRRVLHPFLHVPGAVDSCKVEEIVVHAHFVQALALRKDFLNAEALVHEGQGFLVPGLHADGKAVIPHFPQFPQLLRGLRRDVRDAGKTADGLHFGVVFLYQPRQRFQLVEAQYKGIGPSEEHPLCIPVIAAHFLQVRLHL